MIKGFKQKKKQKKILTNEDFMADFVRVHFLATKVVRGSFSEEGTRVTTSEEKLSP